MRRYYVAALIAIMIALLLFLSCCTVKEKALRTSIRIPNDYNTSTTKSIDSVRQQQAPSVENWKTFFTDSILVQLIDSGLTHNFDVQIAYQKVMQTRAGVQFTKGIRMPNLGLNLSAG